MSHRLVEKQMEEKPHNRTEFLNLVDEMVNEFKTPAHYDNSKGSLYKFAEDHKLNAYEYEVVKRIVRCRKKGEWISDIEKTIDVLKLYQKEQGKLYEGQVEKPNKQ